MTREEFRGALSDIDEGGRLSHSEEARKAEIRLLAHDAEQRAEIARLREALRNIVCAWAFIGGCNEVSRMIDKGRLILEEKNIALKETP